MLFGLDKIMHIGRVSVGKANRKLLFGICCDSFSEGGVVMKVNEKGDDDIGLLVHMSESEL